MLPVLLSYRKTNPGVETALPHRSREILHYLQGQTPGVDTFMHRSELNLVHSPQLLPAEKQQSEVDG